MYIYKYTHILLHVYIFTYIQSIVDRVAQNLEIISKNFQSNIRRTRILMGFIMNTMSWHRTNRKSHGQTSDLLTKFQKQSQRLYATLFAIGCMIYIYIYVHILFCFGALHRSFVLNIHTYICIYACTYIYIHIHEHTYTYVYIRMYIDMYVYIHGYRHIYIYICTFKCIYIYIYIHICIHIYRHLMSAQIPQNAIAWPFLGPVGGRSTCRIRTGRIGEIRWGAYYL